MFLRLCLVVGLVVGSFNFSGREWADFSSDDEVLPPKLVEVVAPERSRKVSFAPMSEWKRIRYPVLSAEEEEVLPSVESPTWKRGLRLDGDVKPEVAWREESRAFAGRPSEGNPVLSAEEEEVLPSAESPTWKRGLRLDGDVKPEVAWREESRAFAGRPSEGNWRKAKDHPDWEIPQGRWRRATNIRRQSGKLNRN